MLAFEMHVRFNDFAIEQKNYYDKVVRGQKSTSPLSFISLFFFKHLFYHVCQSMKSNGLPPYVLCIQAEDQVISCSLLCVAQDPSI